MVCVHNGETRMLPSCDSGGSYREAISKLGPSGAPPVPSAPSMHQPNRHLFGILYPTDLLLTETHVERMLQHRQGEASTTSPNRQVGRQCQTS